jgi:hypothetical protein
MKSQGYENQGENDVTVASKSRSNYGMLREKKTRYAPDRRHDCKHNHVKPDAARLIREEWNRRPNIVAPVCDCGGGN